MTYTYDSSNSQTRSKANLLSIVENPGPRGTSDPSESTRTTTFTYETYCNQVTSVTSPNGLTVTNTNADENGNFQSVSTNIPGVQYNYTFNKYGQVETETDHFGKTTSYNYHSEGAPGGNEQIVGGRLMDPGTGGYVKEISTPVLTQKFDRYDQRGNLVQYNDTKGVTAANGFTLFDELETENVTANFSLSPSLYSAAYGYDNNGNMTTRNTNYGGGDDPISNMYNYTYTMRNMLHTETDASRGMTTTYTYDNNDNLESISNGMDSTDFTYNNRDQLDSVHIGSAPGATSFTYDGNGNIKTTADEYGHTTTNEYDGYDRLKTVIDPLNNKTVIAHLDFGNKLLIQQLDASETLLRETLRVNDPLGRMQQNILKAPGDHKNFATKAPRHQEFFYNKPLGEPSCLRAFVAIFIAGKMASSSTIRIV